MGDGEKMDTALDASWTELHVVLSGEHEEVQERRENPPEQRCNPGHRAGGPGTGIPGRPLRPALYIRKDLGKMDCVICYY